MRGYFFLIVFGVVLSLHPNHLISAGQDKVIDNYLRGETIPEKPLFKAKALRHHEELIGGKYIILTKFGDIVDVLKKDIGNSACWMIRTKDGYVYCLPPSDLKITESEKERLAKEQEAKRLVALENEKQKDVFLETIEDNYQKVVELYKAKKYKEAMKKIDAFASYDKNDYKDIEQLQKKIEIGELEEKVEKLPASKTLENINGYEELLKLNPNNQLYKEKVAHYKAKYNEMLRAKNEKKEKEKREEDRKKAFSDLELISWSWSEEYGYVTAEGQIKNISGQKLKNVEALVTWYDKTGDMVTSDNALVEYNPIMPGQTSPFKVMEKYNPAMNKASIEFKFMWGYKIPHYKK